MKKRTIIDERIRVDQLEEQRRKKTASMNKKITDKARLKNEKLRKRSGSNSASEASFAIDQIVNKKYKNIEINNSKLKNEIKTLKKDKKRYDKEIKNAKRRIKKLSVHPATKRKRIIITTTSITAATALFLGLWFGIDWFYTKPTWSEKNRFPSLKATQQSIDEKREALKRDEEELRDVVFKDDDVIDPLNEDDDHDDITEEEIIKKIGYEILEDYESIINSAGQYLRLDIDEGEFTGDITYAKTEIETPDYGLETRKYWEVKVENFKFKLEGDETQKPAPEALIRQWGDWELNIDHISILLEEKETKNIGDEDTYHLEVSNLTSTFDFFDYWWMNTDVEHKPVDEEPPDGPPPDGPPPDIPVEDRDGYFVETDLVWETEIDKTVVSQGHRYIPDEEVDPFPENMNRRTKHLYVINDGIESNIDVEIEIRKQGENIDRDLDNALSEKVGLHRVEGMQKLTKSIIFTEQEDSEYSDTYIYEWEQKGTGNHDEVIDTIGLERLAAASIIRDFVNTKYEPEGKEPRHMVDLKSKQVYYEVDSNVNWLPAKQLILFDARINGDRYGEYDVLNNKERSVYE